MEACFHCGAPCEEEIIQVDDKSFCCNGCKTVYEMLSQHDLTYYYKLQQNPGISPEAREGKYDFLNNEEIAAKILDFDEDGIQIVSFLIPEMHCSSCIWVLENLRKISKGIQSSQVNFPKKTVQVNFSPEQISLKELAYLLSALGYPPYISLNDYEKKEKANNRQLIYKLGVAGFAFGNVMFLSFPEYFEVKEFWLEQFKHIFRWLMFLFSLPVVFYSGSGYFISAYKGLKSKVLNIDVPIALGIAVLFIRSSTEIFMDLGTGFFDSLTGLVFFLLLGRFFQQKTYQYLSFERDYKSYFPMAVTRIKSVNAEEKKEEQVQIYKLQPGDTILIRNAELIPADAILLKGEAQIDYSFVTGEAEPAQKQIGDRLFAGGRQIGTPIELQVSKAIDQSYLTRLWSNEAFQKDRQQGFQSLIDRISKHFTLGVLSIAFLATLFWLIYDPSKALNVFTAVLIIACPCALALATPFTLGNLLRIMGRKQLYLKDAGIIEKMAQTDCIVFDKTGTITSTKKSEITYAGLELNEAEKSLLTSSLRASNHPLSRQLYEILKTHKITTLDDFKEVPGKGITSEAKQLSMKIGSAGFVNAKENSTNKLTKTRVYLSSNHAYKGYYEFKNAYRSGINSLFEQLENFNKEIIILSGDNEGEREYLETILPKGSKCYFNQNPEDKLSFIKKLQEKGKSVMMLGDGLNDAGALAQSNVGIAISENINQFSPACDGILEGSCLKDLGKFLQLSERGIQIIKWSFLFSFLYNIIGLSFAVTAHLKPVIAAILMPLSSISIVVFTTLLSNFYSRILEKPD